MRTGYCGRINNLHSMTLRLTREPGRFLPAESCAQVVHSPQVSSCTAEHHELLGFPGFKSDKACIVAVKIHVLDILTLLIWLI